MSLESDPHFRESPQLRGCAQTCRQQSSGLPPCPPPSWRGGLEQSPSPRCVSVSLFGERGCWGPRPAPMVIVGGRGSRASRGRSRARPRPPTRCPFSRRRASFRRSAELRSRQRRTACPEDLADQKTCRSQESEICSHDSNRISKDFLSSLFLEICTNFL